MKHADVPVTGSVSSNPAENFEKLAKAELKNKSQLFREMLMTDERRRREEGFLDLQCYGMKKARKKRLLTEADVEKSIFQGRRLCAPSSILTSISQPSLFPGHCRGHLSRSCSWHV